MYIFSVYQRHLVQIWMMRIVKIGFP